MTKLETALLTDTIKELIDRVKFCENQVFAYPFKATKTLCHKLSNYTKKIKKLNGHETEVFRCVLDFVEEKFKFSAFELFIELKSGSDSMLIKEYGNEKSWTLANVTNRAKNGPVEKFTKFGQIYYRIPYSFNFIKHIRDVDKISYWGKSDKNLYSVPPELENGIDSIMNNVFKLKRAAWKKMRPYTV